MNLIQYASKKERVHVEQIIREQPVLKDADNVTIKTISVRKSLGLTMDVFAPAAVSDEPLPVLVDIHGGGLIAGRKEQNRNFCIRMAQNGYLVFAPDYRLVPETNIFGLDKFRMFWKLSLSSKTAPRNSVAMCGTCSSWPTVPVLSWHLWQSLRCIIPQKCRQSSAALTDVFLIRYRHSAWALWRSRAGCSISTKEKLVCWLTATWRETGAKKITPPLSNRNSTPSCYLSASFALAGMTS